MSLELVLLVGQYLAGMDLNLYASIPPMNGAGGMMGGAMSAFMASPAMPTLMFHMLTGMLVLMVGSAAVLGAALVRERPLLAVTLLGLGGIAAAATGGMAYLVYRSEGDSLVMAAGFLVAFGTAVWALSMAWKGRAIGSPAPATHPGSA